MIVEAKSGGQWSYRIKYNSKKVKSLSVILTIDCLNVIIDFNLSHVIESDRKEPLQRYGTGRGF